MSVVLINPFIIDPAQEAEFVRNWRATASIFAAEPGYIDTRLHQSLDKAAKFRFVNIAHWASAESWSAAMKAAPPRETGQTGVQASPALYRLAEGGAVAAKNTSVEREIRDIEDRLAQAYREADAGFLERVLADDYVVTDGPGTTSNKAKVLADYRDGRLKVAEFVFDAVEVRSLAPDVAIASGAYQWSANYDGHALPRHFRYLRVYARGEAGWRICAGQVTPIQAR